MRLKQERRPELQAQGAAPPLAKHHRAHTPNCRPHPLSGTGINPLGWGPSEGSSAEFPWRLASLEATLVTNVEIQQGFSRVVSRVRGLGAAPLGRSIYRKRYMQQLHRPPEGRGLLLEQSEPLADPWAAASHLPQGSPSSGSPAPRVGPARLQPQPRPHTWVWPTLHRSPPTSASLILLWGLRKMPALTGRGHTAT